MQLCCRILTNKILMSPLYNVITGFVKNVYTSDQALKFRLKDECYQCWLSVYVIEVKFLNEGTEEGRK